MEEDEDVIDQISGGAVSRSVFKPAHAITRFYTGNIKCQQCPDGFLASASLDRLNFVDLAKGMAVRRIVLVRSFYSLFFFCNLEISRRRRSLAALLFVQS